MANLSLGQNKWNPDIYQIELDDPVEGGPNGVDNRQAKQLGENALFLKAQMDNAVGGDTAGNDFNLKMLNGNADQIDGVGRDLFKVLKVSSVQAAMAALSARCNGTGQPDFSGLMIGDYIDGIDLSGITAAPGGDVPQAWNNTYKNNRIVISGFNTYKGAGDTENSKNHILFTFRNIVARGKMNSTNINDGGYPASEMRAWLEGAAGDGSGAFASGLKNALNGGNGINYLYTIRKLHSKKRGTEWENPVWASYTVFLPSELEVFGYQTFGDELTGPSCYNTNVQFPIYQKGYAYRIKRYNGGRHWWWEQTPHAASSAGFASIHYIGGAGNHAASEVGGCAPAFCVA